MIDLSGQTLGKYTLIRPVGQGGMATVYLARHESDPRPAAAKVLHRELAGDPEFAARFRREARIIAGLQHPNILQMFDFGEQGDYVYLAMQYISGGSLADELDKGPLPLTRANLLIQQIGSALAYAHQQGVIHRDLKPENILLDETGGSYLSDFGIAKIIAGTTHLTKSGLLMGTPNYMAPEQWRSQPIDGRTDVYAMGMIIYEMLVGLSAFDSDTAYGIMYDHFDKMPASPVRYHPGLPSAFEAVIFKAIAKLPGDRYASPIELAEDFDRVVQRAPHPDHRPERPNKRFDAVASTLVEDFGQSTYQLPRVVPEELPDWVKKLEGVPGGKKPLRIIPPESEVAASAPTASTPAADLSPSRPQPPVRPSAPLAEPPANETILPHMMPPAKIVAPPPRPPAADLHPPRMTPAVKPIAPPAAARRRKRVSSPRFGAKTFALLRGKFRWWVIGAALVAVIVIGVLVVALLLSDGDDQNGGNPIPTVVETVIPTEMPTADATVGPTATTRPIIEVLSTAVPTPTPAPE